jgi:hypothetical protein
LQYPHYTGGGSGVLNKVHLDLGFTKLVSRMIPYRNEDKWVINSQATKLITKYTGGKIGTHTFGKDGKDVLVNSFLANDGTYIGDIESGWWYYNNKFYVCKEYPRGVAIKLKTYSPVIRLVNSIEDTYENFITEQIENDNVEGYYGYTHRGGTLFKIGDRVFDNYYLPAASDYTEEEWNEFNCKTWEQPATEGDLFVFPGKLTHDIVDSYRKETVVEAFDENELFQQRICLAGDFNLIYREASSNATGTQPTENWRMF